MVRSSLLPPVRFLDRPGPPWVALNWLFTLKSTSVFSEVVAAKIMLPPSPPSPPSGPPFGMYFSRRKLTQPLPPRPA